jgi:hypothetical protein
MSNHQRITFNAETAETAEKTSPKISLRVLRVLRSNVVKVLVVVAFVALGGNAQRFWNLDVLSAGGDHA